VTDHLPKGAVTESEPAEKDTCEVLVYFTAAPEISVRLHWPWRFKGRVEEWLGAWFPFQDLSGNTRFIRREAIAGFQYRGKPYEKKAGA
jgi:hypothetical protein